MKKSYLLLFIMGILWSNMSYTQSKIDSSSVIYGWNLDENQIQPSKIEIDTDLVGFQRDNPVLRKYNSVSSLGNFGSAYITNNYFERNFNEDILFLNSYEGYFNTYKNTTYYNTRKPFSRLIYINGGQKPQRVELLEMTHTQNATKRLNVGFNFKILSDKSQYRFLDIKSKSFKIFSSYSGDIYNMHSSFNLNRYLAGENGGIIDSIFLTQDFKPKEYSTNFSGNLASSPYKAYVSNKIRYIDAMISQRVKLFTIGDKNADSTSTTKNIGEPFITHVIFLRRTSKIFTENSNNQSFYPIFNNYYINPIQTYDSIAEFAITNRLQLDFKTKIKKKIIAGIYANVNYDFKKLSYYTFSDTSFLNKAINWSDTINSRHHTFLKNNIGDTLWDFKKDLNLSNIYVSGGIYGKFWTNFQSSFSAKLYLIGYKAGETQFNGNIETQVKVFNNPYLFKVQGSIENLIPSYQLNNYYSNNYVWEQDLHSINRISLSSKIVAPSNKFELSGNYCLLRNYIYLTDSIPLAYEQNINVFAIGIEKEFKLWKFHSYNKLIYQVSENRSILALPEIVFFNSTYFDNTWLFKLTNGRLRTMLGADIHYNSTFNGYKYNPATSTFYQNETQKTGNYPFIDLWFNVNLKRILFFVKMEHYNSNWNSKDYYNAISYPANPKTLKFGLSVTFYD